MQMRSSGMCEKLISKRYNEWVTTGVNGEIENIGPRTPYLARIVRKSTERQDRYSYTR